MQFVFVILAFLGILWVVGSCSEDKPDSPQVAAEKAEEKRKGFHCLSAWDGSHRGVVREVKSRLRDPNSFEHDETRITPVDEDGFHTLIMKYRARNGFGGMVGGYATARISNEFCDAYQVEVE